jgi:hypothetical protein
MPSPLAMRLYKVILSLSPTFGTDLFLNHEQIPISDQPCFTGSCVAAYHTAIWVQRHILSIWDSMQHGYNISVNTNELPKYKAYMRNPPASDFIKVVNFHIVSSDFLGFVQAYRSQDSITIENGYNLFAPIWKILGQAKYLEATWEQMNTL